MLLIYNSKDTHKAMHNFIKKMTLLCLRKSNSDATCYVHPTQTNLYTNCYRKIRRYISFFITPIILSLLIACGSDPVPPTSISSAAELAAIRTNSTTLSGSYALTENIDLSSVSNWQPIGDFAAPFSGSFDGSGYNISGISSSGSEDAGLFGYVENASISNVGVLVGDISSSTSDLASAGGLIGYALNSRISNSYAVVEGNVLSSSSLGVSFSGGLVGVSNDSPISNSYALVVGSISSLSSSSSFSSYSGGLVGWAFSSDISNSYAVVEGNILSSSSNSSYSGGLVGQAVYSDISNSYAVVEGNILPSSSSSSFAGGLVGMSDDSQVSNSYAVVKSNVTSLVLGDMDSFSTAGGLVGTAFDNSQVSNSYALVGGSISSSSSNSDTGGLVGYAYDSQVSNSYAVVGGSISSSSSVAGGLVGFTRNNSPISNSYYKASRESSEGVFNNTLGTSQTLAQLRELTAASARWDGTIWDFGTNSDLPMLFDNPLTAILPPAFLE